jgi:hypothetical protein
MLIPFVIAVPITYSENGFRICSRYVAPAAGVLSLQVENTWRNHRQPPEHLLLSP